MKTEWLSLTLAIGALSACQGSTTSGERPGVRITGYVTALAALPEGASAAALPRGDALPGVRVSLGDVVGHTDDKGRFALEGVPAAARLVLGFEKDGYAPSWLPLEDAAPGASLTMEASLAPLQRSLVDAETGGEVVREGVTLTIPPRAIVDERGVGVSGPVDVSFTPVLPSRGRLAATPGDFTAERPDGGVALLQSYLMFDLDLQQEGRPVRLRQPVKLAVDAGRAGMAKAGLLLDRVGQVPFWGFEPATGRWTLLTYGRLEGTESSVRLEVTVPSFELRPDGRYRVACAEGCPSGTPPVPRPPGTFLIGGTAPDPTVASLSAGQVNAIGAVAVYVPGGLVHRCAGTLVRDDLVMTSASCATESDGSAVADLRFVVGEAMDDPAARLFTFGVDRVLLPRDVGLDDLALLVISPGARQAARARGFALEPIPVAVGPLAQTLADETVQIAGYGAGGPGEPRGRRRFRTERLHNVADDQLELRPTELWLRADDAGGPMLIQRNGRTELIGVLSHVLLESKAIFARGDRAFDVIELPPEPELPDDPPEPEGDEVPPADPVPSPEVPDGAGGRIGPAPRWFNIDMFGRATGLQGDVVDAVGHPVPGAYVSFWNRTQPDGHTYTHTCTGAETGTLCEGNPGHFWIHPVDANRHLAISAAVSLVPGYRSDQAGRLLVYNGIPDFVSPGPIPASATSRYGFVEPNPIVLPACRPGGDVVVTHTDVPLEGGPAGKGIESALAWFYHPRTELDRCLPWYVEAPGGSEAETCEVLDLEVLAAEPGVGAGVLCAAAPERCNGGPGTSELLDVGTSVALRGPRSELVLEKATSEEGSSWYSSQAATAAYDSALFGQRVTLDGVNADGSALLPPPLAASAGTGERDARLSDTLSWTPALGGSSRMAIFVMPLDGSARALRCVGADDGDLRLPDNALDQLEGSRFAIGVYRTGVSFLRGAAGTAIRVVGLYGFLRVATR